MWEGARERGDSAEQCLGKGLCSVRGVQTSASGSVLRLGRLGRFALTLPPGQSFLAG